MPRKGLLVPGLIYAVLLAAPAVAQQQGMRWQHDVEAAKALAQKTNRLVLVHFWTPSCGPCVAMDQSVFNQPGVAAAVEAYFVPVKLNAEDHANTAHAYGVTRIPSDVVLLANGNVVGKMVSPLTPAAYVAELTQVATKMGAKPQPFTSAAAEAPQPAHWNQAYASLEVPAATAPTSPSPFGGQPGDQYAQSQFIGNTPEAKAAAEARAASALFGSPAASATGYEPLATAPAAAPATPPAAPGPQAIDNRYAQLIPPAGAAVAPAASAPPAAPAPTIQASTPPNQFANPYAYDTIPATGQTAQPASYAAEQAPTAATLSQAPTAAPQPQVAGSVATPDGRLLPPGAPPLGFEGYCPVSMRSKWQWVAGDPKWGAIHRGRTYWFISQTEQQQFLANPDYYAPALSGLDPVLAIDHRQAVPGEREHSIDYDNQFYLFSSEATLEQFTSNPERYATGVRQAMGIQQPNSLR